MTNKSLAIKFLKRKGKWGLGYIRLEVLEFAEYLDRKEAREKK